MGFLATDLVPLQSPSPLIPTSKDLQDKIFQVSRTDTVSSVKAVLAADASILAITIHGSSNSNAATTATVTITVANNSGTISTGTVDVKANGATTAFVQMTALPNLEPRPLTGDITISAVYAETGTASTSGGPWIFDVEFVR